jgi:hypothetical protein
MSLTAYVRIKGSYLEEPVVYSLGPVWVNRTLIDGYYTKTGFKPQASVMTGTPSSVVLGDGLTSSSEAGPFVRYSAAIADPTIATPDEMLPSQALRDKEYTMSYLTFYGEAGTGITGVRSTNTFTVATGHGLYNGQLVTLTTTSALPSGVETDTLYYIVGRTATSVSLALTPGGSVITLSSAGTGTHKIVPFTEVASYARSLNPRFSNTKASLLA